LGGTPTRAVKVEIPAGRTERRRPAIPTRGVWKTGTHAIAAMDGKPPARLRYHLYLPSDSTKRAMPLVVMLHGCRQTARLFAKGTRMNALAEREGFAVLYPQQSSSAHPYRCWNWYDSLSQRGEGEAALIAATVEHLTAKHAFDPTRIYVAGLSAGASMAAILAIRHPRLFAAVGLHSGVVFGAADSALGGLSAMRRGANDAPESVIRSALEDSGRVSGMPAVLIHGERDSVVDPINLEQLTAQFKVLNGVTSSAEPSPRRLIVDSDDTPSSEAGPPRQTDSLAGKKSVVRIYAVPALEHAWSGGDGNVPFHSDDGPDASALMWAFFEQHRRLPPG
jgi:poly(hydroxyalkanoate) depolymerase family esterase